MTKFYSMPSDLWISAFCRFPHRPRPKIRNSWSRFCLKPRWSETLGCKQWLNEFWRKTNIQTPLQLLPPLPLLSSHTKRSAGTVKCGARASQMRVAATTNRTRKWKRDFALAHSPPFIPLLLAHFLPSVRRPLRSCLGALCRPIPTFFALPQTVNLLGEPHSPPPLCCFDCCDGRHRAQDHDLGAHNRPHCPPLYHLRRFGRPENDVVPTKEEKSAGRTGR